MEGTPSAGKSEGPTVWLRLAGGSGRAAIGLWGGTGGCCGPFPERGRSAKRKCMTGEGAPHSGFSRYRPCTQCCVSRASGDLDPADSRQLQRKRGRPRQGFVCACVTAVGGQRHVHAQAHQGTPSCPGRVTLALRAHGDPARGPFLLLTKALGGPASSYFLLCSSLPLKGGAGLQALLPNHRSEPVHYALLWTATPIFLVTRNYPCATFAG